MVNFEYYVYAPGWNRWYHRGNTAALIPSIYITPPPFHPLYGQFIAPRLLYALIWSIYHLFLVVMKFLSHLHRYQPWYGQFMVIWGMWSTLLCHNSCGQYIITWKQLYCRTTQNLWNITGELHWGISECDQYHTGRDRLSRGQEQVTLWNVRRKSWQGCITREYNTCVLIVFTTRLASTDLTSFLFVLAWRK